MNFNGKDIFKFLFPESQVIEAIKKYGFISRRNKNNRQKQTQNMGEVYNEGNTYSQNNFSEMNKPTQQTSVKKSKTTQNGNTATYQHKDVSKVNINNISDMFSSIREEMGNLIIGQRNYLDSLCIAFKRPFVTGFDRLKPKNVIIVLGNKSTGKHSSIASIAGLLKQNKLISSNAVLTIDLSLYAIVSEAGVFLSDLYKCLYGQSDIVMFDNFDKCHSSVIDVIESLTTTGKYTLGSRYVFQNNNLIEASGMLLQNSISEISSNGKYFVFSSEKSEKDVLNVFGAKFMECVGDILHTENFNYDELSKISIRIIEDLKRKCSQNISINISYDNTIS